MTGRTSTSPQATPPHLAAFDRMRPMPADVGRYDTGADAAGLFLGLSPEVLDALAGAGLPHRRDGRGDALFDYTDLTNVAFFAGTGHSVPELAQRFLLRFTQSPPETWYEPRTWSVTVRPPGREAHPGHELGPLELAVPDVDAAGVELVDAGGDDGVPPPALGSGRDFQADAYHVVVRLEGLDDPVEHPGVRDAYETVVEALVGDQVVYQTVAEPLRAQHPRAWGLGMADCVVASKVLVDRVTALGVPARARRGYLLGLLGSDHTWCEVFERGTWKMLDPVFPYLVHGTAAAQFSEACCGNRFNRLLPCSVADGSPLIRSAGGAPVPLWALAGVSARPWRTGVRGG